MKDYGRGNLLRRSRFNLDETESGTRDTFGARWPRPSIALGAADKAFAKTVGLDDGTTAVGAVI
jgi:hypothetical protein